MVVATDDDANGNAQIVYSFPNFALISGPFQISRTTGLVTVRSDGAEGLDRESQDFYEVSILKHSLQNTDSRVNHPLPGTNSQLSNCGGYFESYFLFCR
jgi:hypothetical protein